MVVIETIVASLCGCLVIIMTELVLGETGKMAEEKGSDGKEELPKTYLMFKVRKGPFGIANGRSDE